MDKKIGILYVCATPIGNLGDITLRALETLKSCDYIAAEDTRHTLKLLNHYNIKNRLISYHEHNERIKAKSIIELLMLGNSVALVSDAGMPLVSDPGSHIVNSCYENGIDVSVIPGASALLAALVLSGFSTESFVFEGFLPKAKKERIDKLCRLKAEKRTVILYEAPHRIKRALAEIFEHIGDREVAIVKEITKIHEEVRRLSVSDAIEAFKDIEPKGEFVLVLRGNTTYDDEAGFWVNYTPYEHVSYYTSSGMKEMDAIKKAANDRGVSKNEIYGIIKCGKNI